MNQKELKELIEFLIEKDIAEFELERGDVKVRIKRNVPGGSYVVTSAPVAAPQQYVAPAPVVHHSAPQAPSHPVRGASADTGEETDESLHTVKSPIVGTFYESPSPGAPPFLKVGDTVTQGQVLCIVEAMKLMNEIEADASGEIVKRMVQNGQPVEYGQPLFAIRQA